MAMRHSTALIRAVFAIALVVAASSQRHNAQSAGPLSAPGHSGVRSQREPARSFGASVKSVPYFQASIPMRIYECIRNLSVLRCTKLYVLQKMEERKDFPKTGNLTRDFLDQFFGEDEEMGSLVSDAYMKLSDEELNKLLLKHFQKFFIHREIKLHFLPGILVRIVPSKTNKLTFSLKKTKSSEGRKSVRGRAAASDADEVAGLAAPNALESNENHTRKSEDTTSGGSKRKNKKTSSSSYKNTILQMAVPVMVMPAILMGTFLPFVLPVLKMATIMTMLMNNSAFIAALIYAARTHANAQDEQHINYGHPGYH